MKKRYYEVTAKFGHVGKNNYIRKKTPVIATSGKDAAYKTRWMGRVKHHDKHAIINVKEITEEEYLILKEVYENDPYFTCSSIQEQNDKCADIKELILKEESIELFDSENDSKQREERVKYKKHKNKIINDDTFLMMRNYDLYLSYECI